MSIIVTRWKNYWKQRQLEDDLSARDSSGSFLLTYTDDDPRFRQFKKRADDPDYGTQFRYTQLYVDLKIRRLALEVVYRNSYFTYILDLTNIKSVSKGIPNYRDLIRYDTESGWNPDTFYDIDEKLRHRTVTICTHANAIIWFYFLSTDGCDKWLQAFHEWYRKSMKKTTMDVSMCDTDDDEN